MDNLNIALDETNTTPILLNELGDSLNVFGKLITNDTPSVITQGNLNRIFINREGRINSTDTDDNLDGNDTAIQVEGTNTIIDNQGTIHGDFNGINVANGGEASAIIFNHGVITSDSRPVNIGGNEVTLINLGHIFSTADPRNGTVYGDVTANTFFIENRSEGIIDVGKGNNGDAISLELGAEVSGVVINQGVVQGRGLPDGAPDNQANQAAAVRLYWVEASEAETSIFNGNIENSGVLAAEKGATVLIENRTELNGSIINTGTIQGGLTENGPLAITAAEAEGSISVVNGGTINGDVVLSAGNDDYDGSQGTLNGIVFGKEGNDLLVGGDGKDIFSGGLGNDFLADGNGDDLVKGNEGNDFFFNLESRGNDILLGGAGNDFFRAGNGNNLIDGGAGNDLLIGNTGKDLIIGGSGINISFGGGGKDDFFLASGGIQDIQDFTAGEDFFLLEEGLTFDDLDILPALFGSSINIAQTGEQIAAVLFVSPDQIGAEDFKLSSETTLNPVNPPTETETQFNNPSQGTPESDFLLGSEGQDFLSGNEGDDSLLDPAGQDFLNGDAGDDFIDGGLDEDVINGGVGNDVLSGNDFLNGDAGDDVIQAGSDNDFINGGEGNDRIFGNGGMDFISGDADDDILSGGDNADLILGGQGEDRIFGDGGTDALNGGEGNDFLFGWRGRL
ncbi:MAG: hypothetical protein GVY04_08850 [Cyanobacteria bacterium]|jgi:Ca2+-binding RTX toxin-like protein|nr:hypothetical protein [Cyanobacteria bacterium GSL.Bin1]